MMRVLAGLMALALFTGCGSDPDKAPVPTSSTSAEAAGHEGVTLTEVAQMDAPIAMAVRPGSRDLYVAERPGTVRLLGDETPVAQVTTTNDSERGLLGLTFNPTGDRLYVSYTDPEGNTRVDEFTMDGDIADPASQRKVFATEQPFSNHNGGQIAWGPDGHLYLGLGDGGSGGDPLNNAQNPNEVLGSILRFDLEADEARPEIWLIGVRNPWRFSWDRETDDLWIADVGQNAIEEITVLFADGTASPGDGANLGWPIFEGHDSYDGEEPPPNYVPPIFTYTHDPGCSITGGYVSRGDALPALQGAYLYSDYCDPTVYALVQKDGEVVEQRSLDVTVPGGSVASFGQGPDGELYVLSLAGGIYRIDPA